jgi:hypothetical protein
MTPEEWRRTPVEIPADEIIWQNGQWAVTTIGIESRFGTDYIIPKEQLLETRKDRRGDGISVWGLHLAVKTWVVDIDEFVEALAKGLNVHHPDSTTINIELTLFAAREDWAEVDRSSSRETEWFEYPPGRSFDFRPPGDN